MKKKTKEPEIQISEKERQAYVQAYVNSQIDANKRMSIALAVVGVLLLLLFIGFLCNLFGVAHQTFILICIAFPVCIVLLFGPITFIKSKRLEKPTFRIFIISLFVLVVAIFNIVLPKHSLYGWAILIVLTNHYYNTKLGINVFVSTLILLLLCMYLGMFLGEYDPHLLSGQLNGNDDTIHNLFLNQVYQDTPQGRMAYLHDLIQVGQNRYLSVLTQYYLPRSVLISIIFFISNSLNKRTGELLKDEILVGINQQKTKTELEVAKEIQLATLPVEFVTNKDVEIQAELLAAKEVGGDFYDYFTLDEEHIAIVIGDVSGKGIPAAMFMMKTITCFKNYINLYKSPSEILRAVNKSIFNGNESRMFVTCFLAIINTKTGEMKYANAGHNQPIVGQKKDYKYLKCNSGFLLGCMPEAVVMDESYQLNAGDTITLYTDGVTEAMNKNREQFGEQRLINFYNKKVFSCLLELHKDLKDEIESFVNGAEQSDDLTYLTLKYHGDEYVYEEKVFKAQKEQIKPMLDFLKEFGLKNHFDIYINKGMIIADELLSNIVKYGYKDYPGNIYIRALHNIDKKELIFTIIDSGIPFNPFEVNNKPLEGEAADQTEGGLGILLVKQMMTEYAYDRINGKNIVVIKKRFE